MFAYVGCRTTKKRNARGKGISCYEINDKGDWTLKSITKILENPSFLAFDRTTSFLYTVHGDDNDVSAFKVENDGSLTSSIRSAPKAGTLSILRQASTTSSFLWRPSKAEPWQACPSCLMGNWALPFM